MYYKENINKFKIEIGSNLIIRHDTLRKSLEIYLDQKLVLSKSMDESFMENKYKFCIMSKYKVMLY